MKQGNKSLLISLIIIIMVAPVTRYVVSAVSTKQQVDQIQARASDPNSDAGITREEGKKIFMENCDNGQIAGATEYCGCMFDSMEADHGMNWMAALGLNKDQDAVAKEMQPYTDKCLGNTTNNSVTI